MIGVTHMVFGLAIGKLFDLRVGTVMIFAVLPDIDQMFVFATPIVRNGVMHSVATGFFLSICVLVAFDRNSTAKSSFAGYLSHLVLDFLCINGLMIFYPLQKYYSVGFATENNLAANFAILSFSLLLFIYQTRFEPLKIPKVFS